MIWVWAGVGEATVGEATVGASGSFPAPVRVGAVAVAVVTPADFATGVGTGFFGIASDILIGCMMCLIVGDHITAEFI